MDDDEYIKSNREKSMTPKLGKFWCSTCDANLVSDSEKCSVCGKIEKKKKRRRLKKETSS